MRGCQRRGVLCSSQHVAPGTQPVRKFEKAFKGIYQITRNQWQRKLVGKPSGSLNQKTSETLENDHSGHRHGEAYRLRCHTGLVQRVCIFLWRELVFEEAAYVVPRPDAEISGATFCQPAVQWCLLRIWFSGRTSG